MTQQQLELKREEICYKMIEADQDHLKRLEQELDWIEELLKEQINDKK